ncbi:MAG: hypothetical protein QOG49_585, partial [Frankiaceae bacterium]|nr:hypothetical protein [Frankiaceae bacterium]
MTRVDYGNVTLADVAALAGVSR